MPVTDPGFETGTGWTLDGSASRVTGVKRSGSYSLELGAGGSAEAADTGGSVAEGTVVRFGGWFRWDSGTDSEAVKLWLNPAEGGTPLAIIVLEHDGEYNVKTDAGEVLASGQATSSGGWFFVEYKGPFLLPATPAVLAQLAGTGSQVWNVDDIMLEVDEVITRTIRDALITDLEDIDGTGNFSTAINETGAQPEDLSRIKGPAAFIVPSVGGEADAETMPDRKGIAEQFFVVQAFVRSDDPHDDVMDLMDDIRNACERPTANLRAVSGVSKVTVTNWSEVYTSKDVGGVWGLGECNIRVQYLYTRGEL